MTAAPPERLDAGQSLRRFLLEAGPLGAFFIGYVGWDLWVATGVLMAAVLAALVLSYHWERRIPLMPVITAIVVVIFGGLTLLLQDEVFIKMKPTIVNALFAVALLGGLALGKPLLKPLFGPVFQLDEAGWKKLSLRWALFFIFLALLNEVIWRSFSTDFWVNFKVFGNLPLTLLFAPVQVPLIQRHSLTPPESARV
jgi:intracellular septation protein